MENFAWVRHVFSIELRKILSYRVNFWIQFLVSIAADITIAYFLWSAIFQSSGSSTLGGYSFHGILFYYLFGALSAKIIQGTDHGFLSQDIYDGGLNRYLLYPLPFLGYKYLACLAQQFVAFAQLILCLGIAIWFWSTPQDQAISIGSFFQGSIAALLAAYLFFIIGSCLELVAFWQDTVWNLYAMLRFIGSLIGGQLIPLAFFPTWGRSLAAWTPFPLIYDFPIRSFLGQVGPAEWMSRAALLLAWSALFTGLASWIWSRGTRRYSGVGI